MPTTRRRTYTKTHHRTTHYGRSTGSSAGTRSPTTYSCTAPGFNRPRAECQWRMSSYRTVYSQFSGTGTQTPFSPATANKWIRFVNSGYRVYKFTNSDFTKHFGAQWSNGSPTTCYRWMRQKYGAGIKGLARGKGSTWLVAATPSVTARPFMNYKWK